MNCEILRHEKRTAETALFSHLSLIHYFFTNYPYANTETLILSRKLPSGFRDNTGSFRVCIWVLPDSIYSSAKVAYYHGNSDTNRQNSILSRKSRYLQAKPLYKHGNCLYYHGNRMGVFVIV